MPDNTPLPRGNFGVIYADFPWAYKMRTKDGYAKSPEAHYETMSDDEICAMRDDILFATGPRPNCVLIGWGVWPKLPSLIRVLNAWGFEYCTGGNWTKITKHGKQQFGTGYVLRSASEPFVIGRVGQPKIKNRSTRGELLTGDIPDDLRDLQITVSAGVREHSRKPDEMIPLIENLFDGPYLELFARTPRPGWTVWGNQTDKFKESV